MTFMNASGEAVGELLRYFKIDVADLLVVVDEVQLPLGQVEGPGQRIGRRAQRAEVDRPARRRRVRQAAAGRRARRFADEISRITCSRSSRRTRRKKSSA